MTSEAKALALVNGVKTERGRNSYSHYTRLNRALDDGHEALCRTIEQIEAFRQEVSDAVANWKDMSDFSSFETMLKLAEQDLFGFIIPTPKPDPLVEAMHDCGVDRFESWADQLRAALEARGLEIREKNDD